MLCARPRGRDHATGVTGYVVTRALGKPLLSLAEAKVISKRIISAIIPSGSIGKQLKKLRKRSASVEPLLQAQASLNLSPPGRIPNH